MPFPNKEIEDAYRALRPVGQGYFKDERTVQKYMLFLHVFSQELQNYPDEEAAKLTNDLIAFLEVLQEVQCRHGFTEGWLAAKGQSE